MLIVVKFEKKLRLAIICKLFVHQLQCYAMVSKGHNILPFMTGQSKDWHLHFYLLSFAIDKTFARCVQQVSGPEFLKECSSPFPYPFVGADGCVSTTLHFTDVFPIVSPSLFGNPGMTDSRVMYCDFAPSKLRSRSNSRTVHVIYVKDSASLVSTNLREQLFGIAFENVVEEIRYV